MGFEPRRHRGARFLVGHPRLTNWRLSPMIPPHIQAQIELGVCVPADRKPARPEPDPQGIRGTEAALGLARRWSRIRSDRNGSPSPAAPAIDWRTPRHSTPEPVASPRHAVLFVYLTAVASSVATALAWLVPETVASAALGWLGAGLLVYSMRLRPTYLPAYVGGMIGHAIAFYWVFPTVSIFGGFGLAISGLIFAVYVVLGSLLFPVFSFFYRNMMPFVDRFALRAALAIALAELVTLRLFPWHYGHTQIAFRPFVQLAGLGGAILVSFVMFWVAEAFVRALIFRERRPELLLPLAVFGVSLGYGAEVISSVDHRRARTTRRRCPGQRVARGDERSLARSNRFSKEHTR